MGKDKPVKAPAAAPAGAVDKTDEKKQPIARGHRQRGAGTVITAKAAVVTNDGITLKAHERLPCQILNEYCQREKRPRPKFFPNPPGHRMTVVLEDTKNSKNDLRFSPVQTAESETVARDFAALLALFHLQRSIPLERKLPEPYASTWLDMLNAAKPSGTTASGSSSASKAVPNATSVTAAAATVALPPVPPPAVKKVEIASAKNTDKEKNGKSSVNASVTDSAQGAQWLCDNCGNINFEKTLAGVVRTKCFKCQFAKPERCATVSTTKPGHNGQHSGKAPPKAITELRSQTEFASRAEIELKQQQERNDRNRRLTFFDALKRANRPKAIHLKPDIRDRLEALLGIEHSDICNLNTHISGLKDYIEDVREEGLVPEDLCFVDTLQQATILQQICQDFSDEGRSATSIVHAVKTVLFNRHDEFVEDFVLRNNDPDEHHDNLSIVDKSVAALTDLVRETLRNRMSAKLSVVATTPSVLSTTGSEKINRLKEAGFDEICEGLVDELQRLGWRQDSSMFAVMEAAAASEFIGSLQRHWQNEEKVALDTATSNASFVAAFLHSLAEIGITSTRCDALGFFKSAWAFWNQQEHSSIHETVPITASSLLEEVEVMQSILPPNQRVIPTTHSIGGWTWTVVTLQNISLETIRMSHLVDIEFWFAPEIDYPGDAGPLVLVKKSLFAIEDMDENAADLNANDARLLALTVLSQELVASLKGSPIMFEVYSLLNNFESDKDILAVLRRWKVSKAVAQCVASLITTQSTLDEESINKALSDLEHSLDRSAEDLASDKNDVFAVEETSSEISGETDLESMSFASANVSSKKRSTNRRQHPFWTTPTASIAMKASSFDPKNSAYVSMLRERQKLPSFAVKADFLRLIVSKQVMVVTGETGCGKTTQIPQFIHEENRDVKILICQPRRLAAIGVATRVAEEQATPLGERVGYMVKGDSKVSSACRIMFCTYGVLLRRLQDDPAVSGVDYIVFDEVHERGIDSDFCLALMMQALEMRPNLKLILMSATISTDHFRNYLQKELNQSELPPLLHIPGFTHPVEEYFKADFEETVRNFRIKADGMEPSSDENADDNFIGYRQNANTVRKDIDYDLIVKLVFTLLQSGQGEVQEADTPAEKTRFHVLRPAQGCILVFFPGVPEINKFIDFVQQFWPKQQTAGNKLKLQCIALHSNVSTADQKQIFVPARQGYIKLIAATNIAEASVTIPDVSVVIDTCRVKEIAFDPETEAFGLMLKFAARDSLRQRKGRAGRVSAGRCFRMITSGTFEKLPGHSVPEMLRLPLESIVLQVWAMNSLKKNMTLEKQVSESKTMSAQCQHLLSRCPDSPSAEAILLAESNLLQLQALDVEHDALSALGWHLSRLPCTPRIGRLLIFGSLLQCIFPVACVAATMTLKSPFIMTADSAMQNRVLSTKKKYSSGELSSDYNVIVGVMIDFQHSNDQRGFCKQHGLAFERMLEIRQTMRELLSDLVDIGLLSSVSQAFDLQNVVTNGNALRSNLLTATYCSGMYPQVAKILRPPKRFIEVMGGAMERDVEAKEIKFYISPSTASDSGQGKVDTSRTHTQASADFDIDVQHLQRVFLHSSSVNFSNSAFKSSNYLLFGERQVVVQSRGSSPLEHKLFLRDTNEVTAYALLFFGGELQYDGDAGLLLVDKWIRFSCSPRIAALVKRIRQELDSMLANKFENPSTDLTSSPLLTAICDLLDSSSDENR